MVLRQRDRRLVLSACVAASLLGGAVVASAKSLLDGVDSTFGNAPAASADAFKDLDAASDKLDAIWTAMPLAVRHVTFEMRKAPAFGMYEARSSNEFAPGETLYIYAEPVGYVWKPMDGGTYAFGISADLGLKDAQGNLLFKKDGFAKLPLTSHNRAREFMINFDVTLKGLKPGPYTLDVTLHDLNGSKSTTFSMPFKISDRS